jgi:hypothetical protein
MPEPLSKPHPPILIGGLGEQKTMRFVAKYGDACNFFARAGLDAMRHRIDLIKRYCDEYQRDPAEIEITTLDTVHLAPGKQSTQDVIGILRDLATIGVRHAIFNMPNAHEITPLEQFAKEIIPAAAAL